MDIIFGDGKDVKSAINTNASHIKVVPETTNKIFLILGINRVEIKYQNG